MAIIMVKELYLTKYLKKIPLEFDDIFDLDGKKTKEIVNRGDPELDRPRALVLLLATERLKQWPTESIIDDAETLDNYETSISDEQYIEGCLGTHIKNLLREIDHHPNNLIKSDIPGHNFLL
jgi:hypothetical protein